MLPAFLTTVFFALSVVFAARSTRLLGGATANLGRMIVALTLLASWAHCFGKGLAGPSLLWFLASGCVGFGFGDLALYLALTRIGPRLTVLLLQSLAVPFGVAMEWAWLGTAVRAAQLACAAVILLGVILALAPDQTHLDSHRRAFWPGVFFGVLAALGQGAGAVVSRKAYAVAKLAHFSIDAGTAAYQRMLGGILVSALFFLATMRLHPAQSQAHRVRALPWVALNALAGPTLGVACYQWALAGNPSGVVLPIVAATPVVAIPLAWFFEGDRPSARSVLGGAIAVAGCAALTRV